MNLRTLASLCLGLALFGAVLLSFLGLRAWREASGALAQIDRILEYHDRAEKIGVAVDYATLLRPDEDVIAAIARDASDLAGKVESIDSPATRLARDHLIEMAHISDELASYSSANLGRTDDADGQEVVLTVVRQMRIHEAGVRGALHQAVRDRNRRVILSLSTALGGFVVWSLLFAAVSVFAFGTLRRRVGHPIRRIEEGIRAVETGDLSFRIAVDGSDELGRLADAFNRMAEHRQADEAALAERVKELRCLYRVLGLTTDASRSVDDVCAEVSRILPESLMFPEVAVARVVIDRDGVGAVPGEVWPEAVAASLRSDIVATGKTYGFVEVAYREPRDAQHGGERLFLTEERELVDSVAVHLGHMLHDRETAAVVSQAERLSAVGQLTGGVAHDFNNLLTVILGNADVLTEALAGDPRQQALAEMISIAAQRAADLTQRLLAFARRQPLEPRQVDINRLVGGMDGLLRRTLGKHIEIEFARGADLWTALIDPSQLENSVLNLCINARDAMPRGGRLKIETANAHFGGDGSKTPKDVRPGDYVMLAVSDSGHGIPAEQLGRVFEPFFTTKEKAKGTGLGLSMVYGFVKQSGGHVQIDSAVGEGTTVHIYLPRFVGQEDEHAARSENHGLAGGSETILVVEDDVLVLSFALAQLTGLGYTALSAANGPEALEIVRARDDIALMFTDVVMPGGMNGRELAEAARAVRPGLKVLYASGYAEAAIVHDGRLDDDVQLLSKPYRRADLARRVREILDGGYRRRG